MTAPARSPAIPILLRAAWIAIAAVLAFGAAGIVAGMDHVPGTDARPELTFDADGRVRPALAVAVEQLVALEQDVADLGATARAALAAIATFNQDTLAQAIEDGDGQIAGIEARTATYAADVAAVPFMGPGAELRVSDALRTRHGYLEQATRLTADLDAAWGSFDTRAFTAARVAALLRSHDRETGDAARAGSEGRYADALDVLARSDTAIADARALVDELAGTTDTTVLVDWLDRNAAYDAALRTLYETVIAADGRATDAVLAAIDAEQAARAALPSDGRALFVIMADIAQGGMNQALIRIEQVRGSLVAAIALQRELESGVAVPD